jgi:putative sigma-54 modulation protein
MQITIKATNLELTQEIRDYLNEKIGSLEKFKGELDGSVTARAEVGVTTGHHRQGKIFRAEVNLSVPGGNQKVLRAVAEREDLFAAIDEVKDKLQRGLKKYRRGLVARQRRGARISKRLGRFSPLSWFKSEIKQLRRLKRK